MFQRQAITGHSLDVLDFISLNRQATLVRCDDGKYRQLADVTAQHCNNECDECDEFGDYVDAMIHCYDDTLTPPVPPSRVPDIIDLGGNE